jgi:putative thiazole-containing bacteriocin maturation protein
MDATRMRPQLLRDAYFLPLEGDGLYIRTSHRNVEIPNIPIYPWMQRLAPYLTGKRTLDELTRSLPDDKRRLVWELVESLYDHGVVRDLAEGRPHTLSEHELDRYEPEITFIETYATSPEYRFQTYREQRVLMVGSGLLIEAAVQAGLRSGLREICVLLTDESLTDQGRLNEHLASAQARDASHSLKCELAPTSLERTDWLAAVRQYDAVLHLASFPALGRALLLDEICAEAGAVLVQSVVLRDEAWIGPVSIPSRQTTRWQAAWRRLQPSLAAVVGCNFTDQAEVQCEFLTGAVPPIIANNLVFRLFTHVTETADRDGTQQLLRVDVETLLTSEHRFHAHPLAIPVHAQSEPEFYARLQELRYGGEQTDEAFSEAAIAFLDPRLGVFGTIDEEACEQLPLWVTRVNFADPADTADKPRHLTVVAAADDFPQARYRAMRRAIEVYASRMIDPRRFLGPRSDVWGLQFLDDRPVKVERDRVFADVTENPLQAAPVGVASGSTWKAAIADGIVSCCEALTVEEARRSASYRELPRESLAVDSLASHYGSMLQIVAPSFAVYDITGSLRVPTFAFSLDAGEQFIAFASAPDPVGALRTGLERSLLAWQIGLGTSAADAVVAETTSRMSPLRAIPSSCLPEPLAGRDPGLALALMLDSAGYKVVLVPLDFDPEIAELAPYLVRVVLVDAN